VPLEFAGTAIFGIRDRDEVVNKIKRANTGAADPFAKTWIVEPGVTNVQIGPFSARAARAGAES